MIALAASAIVSGPALACQSTQMQRTENGLLLKVIGAKFGLTATSSPGGADRAFILQPMRHYAVLCEDGAFFRVTELPTGDSKDKASGPKVTKSGFVAKADVIAWPTREGLAPARPPTGGSSPAIQAWENREALSKYLSAREHVAAQPTFVETYHDSLRRDPLFRSYPLLGGGPNALPDGQNSFDVLLPAAPPAHTIPTLKALPPDTLKRLESALLGGTIMMVIDATASGGPLEVNVARAILRGFEALPPDVMKTTRIGFVFYRDKEDAEKIVITPEPMPVPEALEFFLEDTRYMSGGGDVEEPLLDAIYTGAFLANWTTSDNQASGQRLMLATLTGPAKTRTEGAIDERVPEGLTAESVGADIKKHGIDLIMVQNSFEPETLTEPTLVALTTASGGQLLIPPFDQGQEQRMPAHVSQIAEAITSRRVHSYYEGKKLLNSMNSGVGLDIPTALNPAGLSNLQALRSAGIDPLLDQSPGSPIGRRGVMIETPGSMKHVIAIDKPTLQTLILLYSAVAVTRLDGDTLRSVVASVVAAISGDPLDLKESTASITQKKLALNFHTPMLDIDLECTYCGMTPGDRKPWETRIQNAAGNLSDLLQRSLDEFERSDFIWMDVELLP